jgi:hypothetical protein
MTKAIVLFSIIVLLFLGGINHSFAQNMQPHQDLGFTRFADSPFGFSFLLPSWFSVSKSTYEVDAYEVKESGEFSFRVSFQPLSIWLYDSVGHALKNHNDSLLTAAKCIAYSSLRSRGDAGESFGRIDSMLECTSKAGFRVLVLYLTQVIELNDGSSDSNLSGPLYLVDISKERNGRILEFDYSGFDMRMETYKQLAASIALSAELK